MKAIKSILFWILVGTILLVTFAQADGNYIKTLYFITFLLPVAIGTSYFFNHVLVPKYLLKRDYWKFGLFLIYTLIVSLYLELLILTLSFITLANYSYKNLNPYSANLLLLTLVIYLIVFVHAFILLLLRYQNKEHLLSQFEEDRDRNTQQYLTLKVDRKTSMVALEDILFIESLADYVKVILKDKQLVTKEKISDLEAKLPDTFLRVHRSFLVNKAKITSFNKEEIQIGEIRIPISRTYKKKVMDDLQQLY